MREDTSLHHDLSIFLPFQVDDKIKQADSDAQEYDYSFLFLPEVWVDFPLI